MDPEAHPLRAASRVAVAAAHPEVEAVDLLEAERRAQGDRLLRQRARRTSNNSKHRNKGNRAGSSAANRNSSRWGEGEVRLAEPRK